MQSYLAWCSRHSSKGHSCSGCCNSRQESGLHTCTTMQRRPWGWERPVHLGPSGMPEIQAVLCLHNAAAGSCPLLQKLQENVFNSQISLPAH